MKSGEIDIIIYKAAKDDPTAREQIVQRAITAGGRMPLGLRRVIRASRDGGRSVDQVASGRTPGKSIFTSDWWIDAVRPKGPTSARRGWRSTRDPVLLVIYVVDEHPNRARRLRGKGPWVCFAAQFPHTGPGGSIMVNRNRGRR